MRQPRGFSESTFMPNLQHLALFCISAAIVGAGCKSNDSGAGEAAAPSDSASAEELRAAREKQRAKGPMAPGIPVPRVRVDVAVNPEHLEPYSGPQGAIEGTVRVSGDASPDVAFEASAECGETPRAVYGKLLREGAGRALADVLITVTEYNGYVPATSDVRPVRAQGCAYDARTIGLTYGQRMEVANVDPSLSYLPTLIGANAPARIVAAPGSSPVKLYPMEVGHYALADGMARPWMSADVFVLRYSTFAVTGLDGKFRIGRIPAGRAKVTAFLPAIDKEVEKVIAVKGDETLSLDFSIEFDAKRDGLRAKPVPAAASATQPAGSAPVVAAPSASAPKAVTAPKVIAPPR